MSIWPRPVAAADEPLNDVPVSEDSLRRWQESLDAMDRGAALALDGKAMPPGIADGPGGWAPPTGLGRLPAPLLDRALEVAARQQQAAAALGASRAAVEHELAALSKSRRNVRPVYVDVSG